MFRRTTSKITKTALAASLLTAMVAAAPAAAEEGTEVIPQTFERTTQNGGTVTTNVVCGEGQQTAIAGCVSNRTLTGADGQVMERQRVIVQGAERTRVLGRTTGPNGNTLFRTRRLGRDN